MRSAIGALALTLALAACGGGGSGGAGSQPTGSEPTASATAPAVAERYENETHGFALDRPEGWVLEEDPSTGAAVQLYALASAADDFAENVNVVVEELPAELTATEYMDAAWAQLEPQLEGVEQIGREELTVGGMPAASIEYRARFPQAPDPVHLLQVAVLDGRTAFVITYTGTEEFDRYRADAEAIIASFSRP